MDAVKPVPGERLRQLRLHRRRLLARRLQGRPHLGRPRRPQRQRVRGLQQVARTRRTRRTSRSPPRRAPARRRPGPTSSPTPRPTRTTRTSTWRSTTPRVTTLAIDDPVLYFDCPIDYTAQCGFDVLAHASEPYVSRLNFETSLGNALHAIKLTSENLREAVWNRPGPRGPRGHDVRAVHRRAGVQLRRSRHHPLDLARHQRVLRHPPRPQQRDRAAPRVGVQHAGGLQALRRHRPRDGRRHPRHDRRAGRRGRARRVHPAAARRGHPGEVHRRHAGLATRRTGWARARRSSTRTRR